MEWVRQQGRIYFGNAGAVKDYRVQLRGNRAIFFWTAYLLCLVLFAMVSYSSSSSFNGGSVATVQRELNTFYKVVVQTVQAIVLLVAPVFAAQGIISEYERQSYELLVSAPVTPKYFLVGKLVSGMRTLVLMLVLSLPVASLGVIMGGATWGDVFQTYLYLLLQGVMWMAVAVPIAVVTQKTAKAVFYSYVLMIFAGIFGSIQYGIMFATGGMGTRGPISVPFYLGLFPFLPVEIRSDSTPIFGIPVANVLLAALVALFVVKLCLLGAGSWMSREGAPETKGLRGAGLAMALLLGLMTALFMPPLLVTTLGGTPLGSIGGSTPISPLGAASGMGLDLGQQIGALGGAAGVLMFVLIPFVPAIGSFSFFDGRKYLPSGWFEFREAFTGRPSGGLPYALLFYACLTGPLFVYLLLSGCELSVVIGVALYYAAFTSFVWSLGWWASSVSKTISGARNGGIGLLLAILIFPNVLLGFMQVAYIAITQDSSLVLVEFNPFQPYSQVPELILVKTIILVLFAAMIGRWAESNRKAKLGRLGVAA